MQQVNPKIAFICAGAFGIKSGTRIHPVASAGITFIDTSDTNLTEDFDQSKVYRIPVPVDPDARVTRGGAGQDRRRTAKYVMPHIQPILEQVGQADFYVLLFSASGGSGSVIGPLLARELLRQDQSFIAITLGEDTTTKYLQNSIDTLKSLENISLSANKPIVMSYFQNRPGVPQRVIDEEVQEVVDAVSALVCQHNADLDESDIHNLLNFNNVTSFGAQLACMTITDNRRTAMSVPEPITVVSLFANRDDYDVPGTPHYHKAGYPQEPLVANYDQLHFVVNTITVEEIQKGLDTAQVAQQQHHSTYRHRKALVNTRDDNVSDNDLVLS